MKVQRITFGTNQNSSTNQVQKTQDRNEFLFYPKHKEDKNLSPMMFLKMLGAIAVSAVAVTLYNLKRNKMPMSIVELSEKSMGLNNINYRRTAKELKQKFLYPIKAGLTHKKKNFNSGLILSDTKDKPLKDVLSAFCEHAEELGINVKEIPDNLTKADRRKWVFNAIKTAEESYKENKQYTIINIGNLDNLIDLKIVKPKNTALEDRLIEINKNVYSGIVWTAWTNKTQSIPMYYNDLPVLVTKLID